MIKKHPVAYAGVHFRKCPVEVRELWARAFVLPEFTSQFLQSLLQDFSAATEIVFISTCNRFDVICTGKFLPQAQEPYARAFKVVAENFLRSQNALTKDWEKKLSLEKVTEYLRTFFNEEAITALFRVCSSLDSLVVGEPHILGQVKHAFQLAKEKQLCGNNLGVLFSRAFHTAKRVRRETEISRNGVSIGHAAVDIAKRVYETFDESHNILVVGAGEMGKIVAQHFCANGAKNISVANRGLARALQLQKVLQEQHGQTSFAVVDLESSLKRLGDFEIVVFATGAQSPLLSYDQAKAALKRKGTPTVIVDISVPRNVETDVAKLDNVFVFDVDDLDKIMEHNRISRKNAALAAENIIQNEVEAFLLEHKNKQSLINIGRFHRFVSQIALHEIKRKPDSSAEAIAHAIAKRLVSQPASLIRSNCDNIQPTSVGQALEVLFCLDHYPKTSVVEESAFRKETRKLEISKEAKNNDIGGIKSKK